MLIAALVRICLASLYRYVCHRMVLCLVLFPHFGTAVSDSP